MDQQTAEKFARLHSRRAYAVEQGGRWFTIAPQNDGRVFTFDGTTMTSYPSRAAFEQGRPSDRVPYAVTLAA